MTKPDLSEIETETLVVELARRRHENKHTLNEIEQALETTAHGDNRVAFGHWLKKLESEQGSEPKPCPRCGKPIAVNAKLRPREIITLHGRFGYKRHHHYCTDCKHGFYPLDAQVGAPEQGQATEQLQRRVTDFAVNDSYEQAVERFAMHYSFTVSTCLMRNVVERLPMPDYPAHEPVDVDSRLTVQTDGSMVPMRSGWKEAKLATVLSQAHYSPGQQGKRGCVTQASYVATVQPVQPFEAHLKKVLPPRIAVKDRGKPHTEVVWLGDGAAWIWKLGQRVCPTAVTILDWYHVMEHASDCAKVLFEHHEGLRKLWVDTLARQLYQGQVCAVLAELKECMLMTQDKSLRNALYQLIGYYSHNRKRMNYPEHLKAGRMIGSGMVESAHRHVVQTRMKKAGQRWSERGAEKMVRLRAFYRTHGAENFFHSVLQSAA